MDSSDSQEIYTEISKIASESLRAKLLFVSKQSDDRAKFQEDTFDREYLSLKKNFDDQYQNLIGEISKIVSGETVPTLSEDDLKKYNIKAGTTVEEQGIPNFWATVLTNSKDFYQVNEKDEKILKFLKDIRVVYFEDKLSFAIEFEFAQNEFFTNEKLTKTYTFDGKVMQCKKIEGCTINWTSVDKIPNKIKTVKTVKSNLFF
jgi:nucleosome assembly protein 1-like 1